MTVEGKQPRSVELGAQRSTDIMTQHHTISGRRSGMLWLGILAALALLAVILIIVFLIVPQQAGQRAAVQATAAAEARRAAAIQTVEAEQATVERLYQAGAALQAAGQWDDAIAAFRDVVQRTPGYKDAADRLTQVGQAKGARQVAIGATATAQALAAIEGHYQKGLGYMNLGRWEEAKAEFDQVFLVSPDYKDVQAKLKQAATETAAAVSKVAPTPAATLTPAIIVPVNIAPQGKVEVSSVHPTDNGLCFDGRKAVDGILAGDGAAPCRAWATNGEGSGAWLKITFSGPKRVNQVNLYDRANLNDHVLAGTLSFSDGSTISTGDLPNEGSAKKFSFDVKTVTWVRFVVDRSDGPNIGLSEIEIYGW
jgi:tetratricopeptide (TPR) repeat protein